MIADLKPYPEYKESGLPWLGKVPGHWGALAIRRLSRVFAGATPSRAIPAYWNSGTIPWLTSGDVNLRRIRNARQFITELGYANSSTKWIRPGSLVVALAGQGRTKGMVATVEFKATCNQSLAAIEPNGRVADYRFVAYWLESRYLDLRALVGNGLRDGLNLEHIRSTYTPLPPLDEQTAIVRFLDWANGRLERAIRAKRKVIALLNEQKQAIIHRAVTRGLDPSVPLKPSGIPWLGDIPAHWEVTALRRYWQVTDCKHLTVPFVENGIPLASVVEVQQFSLDLLGCKCTSPEWYRLLIDGDRKPRRGDLIYCRNASVGACALVETDVDFAMGQDVCLIRSKSQNQRFLNYVLHSPFMKHQLERLLVGSTFKRINISEIKALLVTVPSKFEQDAICEALDADLAGYDTAISRLEREIDLLREYRTRLVADVVTGKLDVREAAARFPEESAVEPSDDDAELDDEAAAADEETVA